MTNTLELKPALCRNPILAEPLKTMVDRFLTEHADTVAGLTIYFQRNEDSLYAMGRPRLLTRDGQTLSATSQGIFAHTCKHARVVLLDLIDDESISTHLESIDATGCMTPLPLQYQLTIFQGCAIFSISQPSSFVYEKFTNEGDDFSPIAKRAPACTIILDDTASNHQALQQPGQVHAALAIWCQASDISGLIDDSTSLVLVPPSADEIYNCAIDEIA